MSKPCKLSKTAEKQLEDIFYFSNMKWGLMQAEAYITGFQKSFELLSTFPKIGRNMDEIKTSLRRYTYQKHYIFYTEHEHYVIVNALISTSRNLRPGLFEE